VCKYGDDHLRSDAAVPGRVASAIPGAVLEFGADTCVRCRRGALFLPGIAACPQIGSAHISHLWVGGAVDCLRVRRAGSTARPGARLLVFEQGGVSAVYLYMGARHTASIPL